MKITQREKKKAKFRISFIFLFAFGCDPRNLKQLKDPRRELEVSQKFIFEFVSNL